VRWGIGLYTGQVPDGSGIGFREEYARIIEQAQLAEEMGLDSLWLSEHHGADDGYLPSLLPMAAAILANTERLFVGTAVLLAPFHHPLRLAEDVAFLDQLSGGRFILGVGTGWRSAESRAFGLDPKARAVALEETVAVLRRAWTGERFSFSGRAHQFEDAIVRPAPFTPGGPPIWLGGTGPRALARAGRLGDGHFGVGLPFDAAIASFDAALASVPDGRRDEFSFGQMRTGFLADDAEEAWRLAGRGMAHTMGVHAGWAAQDAAKSLDASVVPVDEEQVRAYNFLGDAAGARALLEPYATRFAGRSDCHLSFRLYHPFVPHESVLRAIEIYGRDVAAVLRGDARTSSLSV
jgi:alkanesulfonate monooxygenase SsuD/methylene tetrahydromethanopterin reductase-like flavin-dependent oxidoreductase (luciferase family)